MSETLTAIPSLDELAKDPSKALGLSPATARILLYGLAGVLPVLIAKSSENTVQADAPAAPEKWLTVKEAMARFNVPRAWLYRHKAELPYSQPSRKVLLFDERKMAKWFANKKMTG